MVAGQPRTTSPPKDKVIELGKDLIEWVTAKADEPRTAWSFWYALKQDMIKTEWEALKQLPEFRCYYEKARAAMAQKLHAQQIEKGMAHRYIGMYERELYDYEDSEKDKDSERKKKAFEDGTENLSDFKAWMNEKTKKPK